MPTPTAPSTHSTENLSLNYTAFKNQTSEDPYLSAPSDPEELSFKRTAISLQSKTDYSPTEQDGSQISPSPSILRSNSSLMGDVERSHLDPDSPRSHTPALTTFPCQNLLSTSDCIYRDLGDHVSPGADDPFFLASAEDFSPEFTRKGSTEVFPSPEDPSSPRNVSQFSQGASGTSQLLSPNLTDHPSPFSDFENSRAPRWVVQPQEAVPVRRRTRVDTASHRHNMSMLDLAPGIENLGVESGAEYARATSPIVKVSSYSRGDSPERDGTSRRASQSSKHLSPGGDDELSTESEDGPVAESRPAHRSLSLRAEDGSWIPDSGSGQAGVDPPSRRDIHVPSPNEMEEERKIAEKNADIQTWVLAAYGTTGDSSSCQRHGIQGSTKSRRRAKSAGDPSYRRDYFDMEPGRRFDDSNIPGPGVLINETSDQESDSADGSRSTGSRPASRAAIVDSNRWAQSPGDLVPPSESLQPEDKEPLPRQFFRARPWQDFPRYPSIMEAKCHPESSNAAIMKFLNRAKNIETASRAATWGTRRLSDSEVGSIIGPDGSFRKLSISKDKEKKSERRNSLFKQLLPKKSNSNLKRKMSDSHQRKSTSDSIDADNDKEKSKKKDSFPNGKPAPQRKLSISRSKSPSLNTSSAVIAMAGQMAAVGGSGSVQATSSNSAIGSWSYPFSRNRSKSEVPKSSKPGLIDLMTTYGGPPVANITSPLMEPPSKEIGPKRKDDDDIEDEEDEEEEEAVDENGVVMEFPVLSQPPIPTIDGFKTQIKQLNPRIHASLVERLAREQVRRYRNLVEIKVKHARAVSQQNCSAGKHCFSLGGQATLLPPRASERDPDTTYAQFQIPGNEGSDDESNAFTEGVVTAAQFPAGVPLPPVKRLPAEFECILCFKVKKFQKPSDWTKHVHEDVQPFTCTFPHCPEPKSFKRKADWVRHENERHRQLEWWICNIPDCNHKCYRKDNFVQHLVREHKKPEPKVKKMKAKDPDTNHKPNPSTTEEWEACNRKREVQQLWQLVEVCRHDTMKKPKDEPCRFCGNVCSSWKKLTVHLAKHMEQIAMPVLQVIKDRGISADTIISPVEPGSAVRHRANTLSPTTPNPISDTVSTTTSPYPKTIKIEQGMVTNATQPPYYSNNIRQDEGFTISSVPVYSDQMPVQNSLPVYTQPSASLYNDRSHYPDAPGSMAGQLAFPAAQPQRIPFHQNSVTYPPPYNAVPRQRAANEENQAIGADSYRLNVSTMGLNTMPIYDPQQQLYMSPTENLYTYPAGIARTSPYDTAGGVGYENATSNPGDPVPTEAVYMQGPRTAYHQFQQ